jgi:hypothetical protein
MSKSVETTDEVIMADAQESSCTLSLDEITSIDMALQVVLGYYHENIANDHALKVSIMMDVFFDAKFSAASTSSVCQHTTSSASNDRGNIWDKGFNHDGDATSVGEIYNCI